MNEETKKYVDFLKDEAESISKKIKSILPGNFNEIEVIYFVSFTMCDLLQAISLSDEKHWGIVNEFLKSHLFMNTIAAMPKNPTEHIAFLNEKSIAQSNRMNEYKNSCPLAEGIVKNVDTMVKTFVNRVSKNVCSNKADVDSFSNNLLPIIKEFSNQHIDSLRKMAGWKKVTGIVDIMVSQEHNIQSKIQKQITDTFDEIELYYYSFYLATNFYQNLDVVNQNLLSNYSTKSLNHFFNTYPNDDENDKILSGRAERFKYYEGMWAQIEYEESEKSSRIAMFYAFASEYIYGNKAHGMSLAILHPELLEILSKGVNSFLKVATDVVMKKVATDVVVKPKFSLFDKIKSFFK